MKKLTIAITLFAATVGSGCLLNTGPDRTDGIEGHDGNIEAGSAPALAIHNASSETICYINISPASDSQWGPDRLGASETVGPGVNRGWRVGAGTWDVRLQDCSHGTMAEERDIEVHGQGMVLTYN